MEYSGIHNRNISTAGDSATGDPSSSTCYGGICMPACSQMVLDRWLLIFGWLFLFVCTFFCVFSFFYMYVFPCLSCLRFSCVFVMVPACTQMDGPGQVALDIWLVVSFSRVYFWMFFFLFLFLCLCVGFSCLCFCVGGIWGPACWQMILDRLCSLVVFKFWLLLEVGIVLFFACRGGISINNWIQLILNNGFLAVQDSLIGDIVSQSCHFWFHH